MRTSVHSRLIVFGFIFMALLFAEQCAFAVGPVAMADPFSYLQEEVLVEAAVKHPQRASDAPASTAVISAEEIETHGYRTLAEALQSVPGVFVTNDRNYSYLWFRGFGRPGDYNGRVLVLINGHRINENIYGGAYLGNDFTVPMEAVDHIEVVKGPSSSLYGDSAFFGVVNVVTKSPDKAPKIQAVTRGGSYGSVKQFVGISPKKLLYDSHAYVAGSYHYSQGQRDLYYHEYDSVNGGIAHLSDGEKDYNFFGTWRSGNLVLEGNSNSRTKTIPTGSYGTRYNDSSAKSTDARYFLETRWSGEVINDLNLNVRGYYDWYDFKQDYPFDPVPPSTEGIHNQDFAVASWFGEEVRLRWTRYGADNALTVGQEVEKNIEIQQTNRNLNPNASILDSRGNPHRWAFYLQQELKPVRGVSLTLGGRADRYETFGYSYNPRAAAVMNLWDGGTAKVLYGSAFRAPTPFETDYSAPLQSKGNANLRPERIRTGEISVEQQIRDGLWTSLGVYASRVSDLISQRTDPTDGLIQYVNGPSVQANGLEWSGRVRLTKDLSTRLGYVLQKTHFVGTSTQLSNSPHHVGYGDLDYRIPAWKLSIVVTLFATSQRTGVQGNPLPPFGVSSLTLRQSTPIAGLQWFATVYNVTNTDYTYSGAEEHLQDAISQDGRHFNVGLDWRWY